MAKVTGVKQRHKPGCPNKDNSKRCKCPYPVWVYSSVKGGKEYGGTYGTRDEAVAKRRAMEMEMRQGGGARVSNSKEILREGVEEWFRLARDGVVLNRKQETFKPSVVGSHDKPTKGSYWNHYWRKIDPVFGDRRKQAIKKEHLQEFIWKLVEEGVDAGQVRDIPNVLRAFYRREFELGRVEPNPTIGLKLPAYNARRDDVRNKREVKELLAVCPERERGLVAMAAFVGLREGELMALDRKNLDLDAGKHGRVHVRSNYDPKNHMFVATKNRRNRTIPITSDLRPYLVAHLLQLGWNEGLVFGRSPTTPFAEATVRSHTDPAWRAAGLKPISFHNLRHTYASLMLTIPGMSVEAVSRWMGHANAAFTLRRYAHLLPEYDEEAMNAYDAHAEAVGW
jgi:integrase